MKKLSFILVLFSASCIAPRVSVTNVNSGTNDLVIDGKIFATAYQQRAAEYRALCFQAYNIARLRVDQSIQGTTPKPRAIMTDIDETVLNNSPYEVHQLLQGKDYVAASWSDWTAKGIADTVPGAVHFLQYASSKGIEVFYVTNRGESERQGTLKNLQKFNFPNADNAHLLLKGTESSKEARKQQIMANHSIILLMGDNMNDLSNLFEKKDPDARMQVANSFASEFGNRFIVLPNPVYGDWESALYHYKYSLTPAQKDSAIKASLSGY